MAELKPGWRRVKFGEVVRLSKERCANPLAEGIERYVGLEHIEPGDLRVGSWGDVADGTTFTTRFRPGQVLFGKRRAYQRKVALTNFDGVCSGDIYVFESSDPSRLLPELLPFICESDTFFNHAIDTSAGSLSPRTNWTSISGYKFALPPPDEQRRLIAAFMGVRAVEVALSDAAQQARVAFRSARHEGFSKLMNGDNQRCSLDELASRTGIVDGPFGSNLKSEHWTTSGIPVVQSQHITSGHFRMTEPFFVSEKTFAALSRSEAVGGDIVMVKKGVNCGACALLPDDHPKSLLSSNCLRIRVQPEHALPSYVCQFLHWYREQGKFEGLIGSTQQRATTLRDVRQIVVPIPSRRVQECLLQELRSIEGATNSLCERRTEVSAFRRFVSVALAGDQK